MITATIRADGDKLFVVHETTLDSEPLLKRLWWPVVSRHSLNVPRALPKSGDVVRYQGDGIWSCSDFSIYTGPGDTQAARVDEEPVPAPKTKLETRWFQGRWQRLLKRGWVEVGARR